MHPYFQFHIRCRKRQDINLHFLYLLLYDWWRVFHKVDKKLVDPSSWFYHSVPLVTQTKAFYTQNIDSTLRQIVECHTFANFDPRVIFCAILCPRNKENVFIKHSKTSPLKFHGQGDIVWTPHTQMCWDGMTWPHKNHKINKRSPASLAFISDSGHHKNMSLK